VPRPRSEMLNLRQSQVLPAPAATATAVPASSPTPAAGTLGLGTSFVHIQRAPAHLRAVQRGNSFLTIFRIRHFDEAKTPGSAGVAIGHDGDPVHRSILLKELAQFVFPRIEIQIPNEDILQAIASVS
jgi:hypothetical protein